jgi:hypothetical protein
MRTRTAVVTGLLAVLSMAGSDAQKPLSESAKKGIQELNQKLTKDLPRLKDAFSAIPVSPPPSSAAGPLPEPSLTEPFEIGEALYDQGRMANAVVSLLELMRIAVVPDANASARAAGVTLSESEVRALIDLAEEDLQASDNDMERLPYKFSDLHASIADLLPGVTVEALAEAYTKAYETRPEDLIAKAMMGRPIEPDTTLTRAQIWFLLMDGFAGAAAGGQWGTADKEVPDLKSPNAQWSAEEFREVLARLPLVTASRLVTMSAPDVVSPGTPPGPPMNVTARVSASAPPLVSRLTGKTLIAARAGSLSGQEVTWFVGDDSMLSELGKIVTPVDEPVRIGADGLARFVIQPGINPAGAAGQLIEDWEPIEARFDSRGLVANAYTVPAQLAGLTLGSTRVRTNVGLKWRSPDVLYLAIYNIYKDINFDIPGLGGGTRDGTDRLFVMLHKRANGNYWGRGTVDVDTAQMLRGGTQCQLDAATVKQRVRVKVEPQTGFGPTHILEDFLWMPWVNNAFSLAGTMADIPPDGGYYRVMIYPATAPPPSGPCLTNILAGRDRQGHGANWFIPLNDAQWTTSAQGYGIALKSRGMTTYLDTSSVDPLGMTPLAGIKALLKLTGTSTWAVLASRTISDFEPRK